MNNDPNEQSAQNTGQAQSVQSQTNQAVPRDPQDQPMVSVPVGGSEGSPAVVESSPQRVENFVQSSEPEPQISSEVSEYVQPTPGPKIKADAASAGVKESIPHGPNYTNLPTDQVVAKQIVKTGDTSVSSTWRALLVIKEFARSLFNPKKTQEAH